MIEYHVLFVGVLVGTEAFFTALSVLNVRHGERTVREERGWVEETLGVDDVEELNDYHRTKTGLSLLQSWVSLGALLLVLYSGLFREAVLAVEGLGLGPVAGGVLFLLGGVALAQVLSWPFDAVDTFVVEEVFGFNEQSPALWLRDKVVGLALLGVLGGTLVAALMVLVETVALWWVAFWVVAVAFTLAMQVLYPRVIAPLFYDFEPLAEGELRGAVEGVFERAGFTCDEVYEMDASSRSSHTNAFFAGFGRTKRVVLFDTLIEGLTRPQLQGVLAHELAHWKKAHVWKRIGANAVQFGLLLAAVGLLVDAGWLYATFDVPQGATYAGVALAALLVGPLNRWLGPVENKLYLKHEREADAFAADVVDPEAMAGALAALASDNLSNPFPHPWYAAFHYTHPPIPDRIRFVRERGDGTDGAGAGDEPGSGPGPGDGPDPDADTAGV
jgi:STE24 endopeptidase